MTSEQSSMPPLPRPHSAMGIASFIISVVTGFGMFAMFVIAGIMQSTAPGGMDERSVGAIILGFCIIGLLAIDLVAAGLGIAGVCQKDRKKIFAVLGIVFSITTVVCAVVLMVIGLAMRQS